MIKLYQSYQGEPERKLLSLAAIPWEIKGGFNDSAREYELFKSISASLHPEDQEPWGMVSKKFSNKAFISIEEFLGFAEKKIQDGFDCVFINPMIANEALHLNVWSQGVQCGHNGLDKIINFLELKLCKSITSPMDKSIFAFCNYFIATPQFWTKYFSFVDGILDSLDREVLNRTEIGLIFSGSGSYHRDLNVSMRPFVIERLFSTFIQLNNIQVAAFKYQKIHYEKKFGEKNGSFLFQISALKNLGLKMDLENLISAYNHIRFFLYTNGPFMISISVLDDPPDFYLSEEYFHLMGENFQP